MALESLIVRALVVGLLTSAPRWKDMRPKTIPAVRGFSIEKTEGEGGALASEFVRLMHLIRDTATGSGDEVKKIESMLGSSRERQVVASYLQLVLTKDPFLDVVDRKLEQEKIGLSSSERDHVNTVLKDVWLDREGRSHKDLLEAVHLLLYAHIHDKISSEDRVVAGSGNSHMALLSPERLQEKVWPKKPGYWYYDASKQRNV